MKNLWAPLLILGLGIWTLSVGTSNFRAFTTEGARRLHVLEKPKNIPNTNLIDMNGLGLNFASYKGKVVVIDFIFTNCPYICYAMGSSLEQVRDTLVSKNITEDVQILSISFDPLRDTVEELKSYAERFGASGVNWNIATVSEITDLDEILEAFGITIIPLADGGYEHNAAIHIVDQTGKLIEITGFNNSNAIVSAVEARL